MRLEGVVVEALSQGKGNAEIPGFSSKPVVHIP